jgi:hypothetical protein
LTTRSENTLSTLVTLIVIGLIVAIIRITMEATNDYSVVVESLTVPSELAARGTTGQALADDLVGRLAAIRSTVRRNSLSSTAEVRGDQARMVRVEIPETGVSLDELEQFLHRWLGHQVLVSGEVRSEADGDLSIALFIPGAGPIELRGPSAGLDRLTQEAAEKVFDGFDPTNYVIYLMASGRGPDALAAAQRFVSSPGLKTGSVQEKASAYSWARTVGSPMRCAKLQTFPWPICSGARRCSPGEILPVPPNSWPSRRKKAPRFADPLKALGDVLVKQRRPKEAQAKYDEALKYAPNWSALKAARAALSEKT